MKHRISFTFSDESYNALVKLAQDKGMTLADTIRDAVALEIFWQKSINDGYDFLIEKEGKFKRILRLR